MIERNEMGWVMGEVRPCLLVHCVAEGDLVRLGLEAGVVRAREDVHLRMRMGPLLLRGGRPTALMERRTETGGNAGLGPRRARLVLLGAHGGQEVPLRGRGRSAAGRGWCE